MGILSEAALGIGALAAGYTLCYYTHTNPIIKSSSDLQETHQQYSTIKNAGPVTDLNDLSIDYIVSEKNNFRGFVFTDNATKKRGVVVKNSFLDKNTTLNYIPLEVSLEPMNAKIPLSYTPQKSDTTQPSYTPQQSSSDELISDNPLWKKIQRAIENIRE